MKRVFLIILTLLFLTGCAINTSSNVSSATTSSEVTTSTLPVSSVPMETSSAVSSSETQNPEIKGLIYSTAPEPTKGQNSLIYQGKLAFKEKTYTVEIMQTKYVETSPEETPLCAVYGMFDIVIRDSAGNETDRLCLNDGNHGKMMGFWGAIDRIQFLTDSTETKAIFGIEMGHGAKASDVSSGVHSGGIGYAMYCVDDTGHVTNRPVDGGYYFVPMTQRMYVGFDTDRDSLNHISVNAYDENGRLCKAEYIWTGEKYILMRE